MLNEGNQILNFILCLWELLWFHFIPVLPRFVIKLPFRFRNTDSKWGLILNVVLLCRCCTVPIKSQFCISMVICFESYSETISYFYWKCHVFFVISLISSSFLCIVATNWMPFHNLSLWVSLLAWRKYTKKLFVPLTIKTLLPDLQNNFKTSFYGF